MKIKADWLPHLHAYRRREVERIFACCPDRAFGAVLELGAGDGFQSRLLSRCARRLVATDYEVSTLAAALGSRAPGSAERPAGTAPDEALSCLPCDAERVDAAFPPGSFDLVFSSNLLEHLPDPGRALAGIHRVLADDGLTIHVVPSPFWKLCHLALHVPNRLVLILERLTERGGAARAAARLGGRQAPAPPAPGGRPLGNNPKTPRRRRPLLLRLLVPEPHGVSRTHLGEALAFRRARWRRELERSGFEIVAEGKGPLASGYGFGLDRLRRLLEAAGLASERYFVAVKSGRVSPHTRHFTARGGVD